MTLLVAALFAALFTIFFQRKGYFQLFEMAVYPIKFWHTAGAFLIYLLLAMILVPILSVIAPKFVLTSWFQVLFLILTFVALVIYLLVLRRKLVHALFWGEARGDFADFKKGVVLGAITWFLSYPYILFVNTLIKLLVKDSENEQVAVQFLKQMKGKPLLLSVMLILVVFIVPFIEELLFRGFLQTWLRKRLSRFWAVGLAAAIFSLVHYAPGQNNLEVICSLFVLSCFLGFIYEKSRILWAPYALHATFNAVSSVVVLLAK